MVWAFKNSSGQAASEPNDFVETKWTFEQNDFIQIDLGFNFFLKNHF
jgi:hypothetical protein